MINNLSENNKAHAGMHLLIALTIIIFAIIIRFSPTANNTLAVTNSEAPYLDPVDTAFSVEKISLYTPNITENLQALEESLFFSQAKSADYLDKNLAKNNFSTQQTQLEREYVIQDGDTISTIAEKFNMHVGTIYERNNLSADNIESIHPGDKIVIPAYDKTDSQTWLADLNDKKEQERQRLLALQKEQEEQERQNQLALAAASRSVYTRDTATTTSSYSSSADYQGTNTTSVNTSGSNGYPYGWCTYYAASRKSVPSSWGNAGEWLSSAQSDGYSTGSSPSAGSIVVTGESWYGHVAYVESVNGDGSITVSEMNYNGWGVTSSRTISAGSPIIKGYIY